MTLAFSLEDIDITVTDNTDDTGADDTVAVQEVEEASEEVENVLARLDRALGIIDNLSMMRDHVKKFGITRPMLHLMNKNNKLGAAIGMTLPSYESDDEPEDVDPADVEVEIVVESIGEKLKSAKNWVVEFFKKIYAAIKEFFTKYFGMVVRLEKRLKKIKSEIIGKNVDREAFGKIKMSVYSATDFGSMSDAVAAIVAKPNGAIDASTLDTNLGKLGYKVEKSEDDDDKSKISSINIVKDTTNVPELENEELEKLGWGFGSASGKFGNVETLVKALKSVDKVEKAIKDAEKKAKSAETTPLKNTDNDEAHKLVDKELNNIAKNTRAYLQAVKLAYKTGGRLVAMYCSIMEKAKIKAK